MVRETRHLWVGNLPETIRNEKIVEHFERYGRVESVKILPRRSMEGGRAAFVDFVDIRSATKAHESVNRIGDRELRTDYNEPSGNSSSMTMARIHGDLRGEPRIDQNSPGDTRVRAPPQPVSPARRRYDRRSEGVLESHYSNRQPGSYDDGYSDNEGGPPRQAISGGRPRYADRGSHGNRSYHRGDMMRRNNMGKTDFHSRGVAVSPSSESDSDSESQSASKSVSGTSSQTSSSDDDSEAESRAVNPASEHMSGHSGRATALCIRNLSMRSSDSSIKEGLFHEFKKYGEVNRIYIHGQGNNRYAVIYFKRAEDADRGMDACHGKMFLGSEMNISLWHESPPKQYKQYDNYYDRYEGDYPPRNNRGNLMAVEDEYDPAATRTLFVGNIEKTTTYGDLKEAFERYGEIVDIDIKKQAGNNPYAFLQFADLHCAIQARRRMDREYVGRNKVKVGFGKVSPINTIWVGGVTASLSEQQLERHFHRYGHVTRVVINRLRGQALISFDSVESAGVAQADMKGRLLYGRRVRVEFVSRDSRQLFFDDMQRLGQDDRRRYYDNPSHDSRPRGRGGFYDRRGGHRGGRGMRGDVRYSGYRQWHGPDYEYRDGGGFHRQGGHPRHRGPYDGYESDDYDKELRDYENFSRQREREKERYRERQRERHERDNHPRNKDEGDYSENERYYMDERDRWQDHECSSGSYIEEEPRDRKERRLREVAVERRHNRVQHRETGDESENEAGPVPPGIKEYEREAVCEPEQQLKVENNDSDYNDKVSTISERHKEQPEKKRKKKEKNIKKLRKSSEFEKVKAEEMATNENVTGHRKKRSLSKDGSRVSEDNEIAAEVVPKGPKTPEPQESEHNEKCALPSPTEEKIVKSKKTTSKKKKKHKRIRTPPEPEVDEETPNVEEVQLSEEKQTEGYECKESISEKVSESGHLENEVKTSAAADVQVMSEKKEKETRSSEDDDKNFSRFPLPDVHTGKRDPSVSPRKQYREDESLKRERSASPRKSYKDEEPNYKHSKGDGLYKVDKSIREEKVNREEKLFREEKLHRDEKPYRDRDSKLYREEKTVREEKPYRHEKTYRTDKQFAEEKTHKDEKSYKETRPYRDNDKSYREEKMYREDKGHSKERRREWEEKERPKRAKVSREESPPPPPPPPPADNVVLSESRTPEARPLPPLGQEMGQYDTNRGSLGLYSPATHSPMQVVGKKQTAAVLGTPTPPMMSPSTHALPLPTQQQYITSTAPLGAPAAPTQQHNSADTLLDLLRRYPVMWQGIIALKNDQAAVQMHYLAGNAQLAELSLPQIPVHGMGGVPPPLRISQRMRLEQSQLEGVIRRMQVDNEHCLLLALPCGRDPLDVHAQTRALRNGFINYLQQKQAAGIINVAGQGSSQPSYVLHIFPPCDFAQEHLARVSPDLLDSAADSGHLMVVVASV